MPERNVDVMRALGYTLGHLQRRIRASWLGRRFSPEAVLIVGIALVLRLLAIPLSILRINTYSQSDARGFARVAATIGHGFLSGDVLIGPVFTPGKIVAIYRLWGFFLSPFWMLPGPSAVYAHIGIACLGALAVYNVFAITRYYHSSMAGILAALPVAVYPSFVLIQSTLLREAAVLAGITTATHLFIRSPQFLDDRRRTRGALAIGVLIFASLLRYDNIPVYLFALGIGISVHYIRRHKLDRVRKLLISSSAGAAAALALIVAPRVVDYLAEIRQYRAQGRTAYLVNTIPTTVLEAIAFAPLGMVYFLFTPFPWMVENVIDVVIVIEGLNNMLFFAASAAGVRYAIQRTASKTVALISGFLVASVVYGIANANVGTVVRHRQMFVWVIYVFGAVGIARGIRHRQQVHDRIRGLAQLIEIGSGKSPRR